MSANKKRKVTEGTLHGALGILAEFVLPGLQQQTPQHKTATLPVVEEVQEDQLTPGCKAAIVPVNHHNKQDQVEQTPQAKKAGKHLNRTFAIALQTANRVCQKYRALQITEDSCGIDSEKSH